MRANDTGPRTDESGALRATGAQARSTDADAGTERDPLQALDAGSRSRLTTIADRLIPAAHGMPSAADVVTDARLRFVLRARPDLVDPLLASLRSELGDEPGPRLEYLERNEPANLAALQLVIVAAYYTDRDVRQLIGYPGQLAIEVRASDLPPYFEEGLIDGVLARGPVWRDPSTGRRAVIDGAPRTYEDRYRSSDTSPEGGHDGRDSS